MADAYDIMSTAKRSGAQVQLREDIERYQDEVRAYQKKGQEKSFWGGLAQIGGGLALNALMPGGGTIVDMLLKGAIRGGLTDVFGQSVKGKRGGAPVFKSTAKGPYGRKAVKEVTREAGETTKDLREAAKAERRGDLFSSLLSGFAPEFTSALGEGLGLEDKLGGLFGGKASEGLNIMTDPEGILRASVNMPGLGTIGSGLGGAPGGTDWGILGDIYGFGKGAAGFGIDKFKDYYNIIAQK